MNKNMAGKTFFSSQKVPKISAHHFLQDFNFFFFYPIQNVLNYIPECLCYPWISGITVIRHRRYLYLTAPPPREPEILIGI